MKEALPRLDRDYSKKENWTVELLEKPLEYHIVRSPEERWNFNLL